MAAQCDNCINGFFEPNKYMGRCLLQGCRIMPTTKCTCFLEKDEEDKKKEQSKKKMSHRRRYMVDPEYRELCKIRARERWRQNHPNCKPRI